MVCGLSNVNLKLVEIRASFKEVAREISTKIQGGKYCTLSFVDNMANIDIGCSIFVTLVRFDGRIL